MPKYIAMWNMPGCLPEMEPAIFDTFEEARAFIADELEREADDLLLDALSDDAPRPSDMEATQAARAEQIKARGTQPRRVRRARFALVASKYCRAGYVPVYERNDAVRDMLSDLRHLCDAWGVAFGEANSTAHDHYLAERGKQSCVRK